MKDRKNDTLVGDKGVFMSNDFYVVDRHLHAAIETLHSLLHTNRSVAHVVQEECGKQSWHYICRLLEAAKFSTDLLVKRYTWILLLDTCTDVIKPFLIESCPSDKVHNWLHELRDDVTHMIQANALVPEVRTTSRFGESVLSGRQTKDVSKKERKQRSGSRRKRTSMYVNAEGDAQKTENLALADAASLDAATNAPEEIRDAEDAEGDIYGNRFTLETFVAKVICKYYES
ncbi:hypothetical protein CYMTET_44602 [Cymbomonas tetramitiformis]|uniref:Uncharacterized protein n=1 Tax=Cymbomonas tetramitiformis TaxID=36881 RepID=A0AAE0EYT7_9CHLO|nr:hypothetical protein CYMTET_44602 [Cymbomonas tetramitiformis]